MDSAEVCLSSSQEASAPSYQSHQQGSASGSGSAQAEAQAHSSESVYDSDVVMGGTSDQEASQVDQDDVGHQIPRRSVESPHVFETSTREPRGRQRHRESSRADRFEGRIYNPDRSRSPPFDRRSSQRAHSFRSRHQRRHSPWDEIIDDISGTDRSPTRFLQRVPFEWRADVVPYHDGERLRVLPRGFQTTFIQESTVLTPMGTN